VANQKKTVSPFTNMIRKQSIKFSRPSMRPGLSENQEPYQIVHIRLALTISSWKLFCSPQFPLWHFEKPLGMSSHRLQGASQSHLQQMQVLADYWLQIDFSVHSHSESKKGYRADLSLYCCCNCQRYTELLLQFNTKLTP
jgi:hypothetical protein